MTKRLMLAGLLALAAAPALGTDAASGPNAVTPTTTDEARAMAAKRIAAHEKGEAPPARACTCSQSDREPGSGRPERIRAGGQR